MQYLKERTRRVRQISYMVQGIHPVAQMRSLLSQQALPPLPEKYII